MFASNFASYTPFFLVRDAIGKGMSPVIVDNTNIFDYHMKPYAILVIIIALLSIARICLFFQAVKNGYEVYFVEPETAWKFKAYECSMLVFQYLILINRLCICIILQ